MFGVIKNELITIHFSYLYIIKINMNEEGLPWWFRVENLSANAGDTGLIPDLERFHMLLST